MNLLHGKSDHEFFRFMRVTKTTFNSLVDMLEGTKFFSTTHRQPKGEESRITETALAVTLWYLGNMSSQREIAERFNISQGHACNLINTVVAVLCDAASKFIIWPSGHEIVTVEKEFKIISNFPGIVGAVDGCHISTIVPDEVQNDYLDRNHNHSVNLLAICDANKKFTYCFSGYPGSAHDQRVFGNSALGQSLEDPNNHKYFPSKHYHLVGDSAFALHTHVMVPYKDSGLLTVDQLNFNKKLSQSRRVIENAFGLLKGRFRHLRRLECALPHVSKTITACCVLHNMTIQNVDELDTLSSEVDDVSQNLGQDINCISHRINMDAKRKRDSIVHNIQFD